MALIFVYGTLKQGFPNTHLNAGVRRAGRYRTRERLPMVLLGDGHVPCILLEPGSGHQVIGEVYEVDAAALAVMDRLERIGEADGYLRIPIEVVAEGEGDAEAITVDVYAKSPAQAEGLARHLGPLAEYTAEHTGRFRW
jgi:gamma-glutamylaminecyclotransferase